MVVSGMQLPSNARLQLQSVNTVVPANGVVTLANFTGSAGLLRQVNMVANSSTYMYQEGCVSAWLDDQPLWLSSGLEDYFLAAYFHTMPQEHLRLSGFSLGAQPIGPLKTNSIAAYRIHDPDPILFTNSITMRWVATHSKTPLCNYDWPAAAMPPVGTVPTPTPSQGSIEVATLAWVYVW